MYPNTQKKPNRSHKHQTDKQHFRVSNGAIKLTVVYKIRVIKGDLPGKQKCTGTSLVRQCKAKIQFLQH